MHKVLTANLAKLANLSKFLFHHSMGSSSFSILFEEKKNMKFHCKLSLNHWMNRWMKQNQMPCLQEFSRLAWNQNFESLVQFRKLIVIIPEQLVRTCRPAQLRCSMRDICVTALVSIRRSSRAQVGHKSLQITHVQNYQSKEKKELIRKFREILEHFAIRIDFEYSNQVPIPNSRGLERHVFGCELRALALLK